jgi:hypothetical protein
MVCIPDPRIRDNCALRLFHLVIIAIILVTLVIFVFVLVLLGSLEGIIATIRG